MTVISIIFLIKYRRKQKAAHNLCVLILSKPASKYVGFKVFIIYARALLN